MKVISSRFVLAEPKLTGKRAPAAPRAPTKPKRIRGLGDLVEMVAKPIARQLDNLGRPGRFSGCSACSKRRAFLNRLVPDFRVGRAWLSAPGRARWAWRTVFGGR